MSAKQEVTRIAKLRWGKKFEMREHKQALTRIEKEALKEKIKAMQSRDKELKDFLHSHKDPLAELQAAAQFVCDVNGDNPSILQLRIALLRSLADSEASAERKELFNEIRKEQGKLYGHKCTLAKTKYDDPVIPHCVQVAAGDSWDEVLELLQGNPVEST